MAKKESLKERVEVLKRKPSVETICRYTRRIMEHSWEMKRVFKIEAKKDAIRKKLDARKAQLMKDSQFVALHKELTKIQNVASKMELEIRQQATKVERLAQLRGAEHHQTQKAVTKLIALIYGDES